MWGEEEPMFRYVLGFTVFIIVVVLVSVFAIKQKSPFTSCQNKVDEIRGINKQIRFYQDALNSGYYDNKPMSYSQSEDFQNQISNYRSRIYEINQRCPEEP